MSQFADRLSGIETPLPRGDASGPLRRDALENRARILDAARRLFAESGVEAVSMHRIAQTAGVGQATLYRHYVHKGELCRDLMTDSTKRAREGLETYLRESEGLPALDRLDGVVERIVAFIDQKLPYLAAIGEACSGESRTSKFNLPEYRSLHGFVAGLLDDAQAEGAIPPADSNFTAHALLAGLSPDLYQYQRDERGLTQQQIVQGVRRLYS
ncbi:MAG: TetR/AcrR family transcriptional regulator [Chloroflexota bacterium]